MPRSSPYRQHPVDCISASNPGLLFVFVSSTRSRLPRRCTASSTLPSCRSGRRSLPTWHQGHIWMLVLTGLRTGQITGDPASKNRAVRPPSDPHFRRGNAAGSYGPCGRRPAPPFQSPRNRRGDRSAGVFRSIQPGDSFRRRDGAGRTNQSRAGRFHRPRSAATPARRSTRWKTRAQVHSPCVDAPKQDCPTLRFQANRNLRTAPKPQPLP